MEDIYRCEKCGSRNVRTYTLDIYLANGELPYYMECCDCGYEKKLNRSGL